MVMVMQTYLPLLMGIHSMLKDSLWLVLEPGSSGQDLQLGWVRMVPLQMQIMRVTVIKPTVG